MNTVWTSSLGKGELSAFTATLIPNLKRIQYPLNRSCVDSRGGLALWKRERYFGSPSNLLSCHIRMCVPTDSTLWKKINIGNPKVSVILLLPYHCCLHLHHHFRSYVRYGSYHLILPYVLPFNDIYCACTALILGAFARLRKATISFVMSVCLSLRPSVHMEQLGSHWTDFDETWYLSFLRKSVEKIQMSLKSDKNTLHKDVATFWRYLAKFFLEWEMF